MTYNMSNDQNISVEDRYIQMMYEREAPFRKSEQIFLNVAKDIARHTFVYWDHKHINRIPKRKAEIWKTFLSIPSPEISMARLDTIDRNHYKELVNKYGPIQLKTLKISKADIKSYYVDRGSKYALTIDRLDINYPWKRIDDDFYSEVEQILDNHTDENEEFTIETTPLD